MPISNPVGAASAAIINLRVGVTDASLTGKRKLLVTPAYNKADLTNASILHREV
jgi:hypothetical protein